MSSTGSGYDLSPTTFSPDGKIFQVEYAAKAVDNSGTAIGIKCKDGVLLAIEKLLISKLLTKGTQRRIYTVATHAGMAVGGCIPDARQIVNRACDEAGNYKDTYGSPVSPSVLSERVAHYVHYFTLHGSLRPFGAAVMLAAYDDELKEPQLYMIDPSGMSYRYFGCAIGKGRQAAKTELEKLKLTELTCREAMKHVAKILHVLHDESKDKPFELEMSWVCEETSWKHERVQEELINDANTWAIASIEEDEMDDGEGTRRRNDQLPQDVLNNSISKAQLPQNTNISITNWHQPFQHGAMKSMRVDTRNSWKELTLFLRSF